MATVTFTYETKCPAADPHVRLACNVNGAKRFSLDFLLSHLWTEDVDAGTLKEEDVALILLKTFSREWRKNNPSGTLAQLRTALEAESWVV